VPNDQTRAPEQSRVALAQSGQPDHAGPSYVGIAANRSSGLGGGVRLVERLAVALRRAGLGAEVAWTPGERAAMVSRAAAGSRFRCLVAVGGDGTVSALLNERPSVPVTVLPAGTENLVAQHFGLGRDPKALARTIAVGQTVRVDLGLTQGRRFFLMAGFGFDADVVTRHHRSRLSRGGSIRPTHRLAYVEPILRSSLSYRFPTISVEIADAGAQEVVTGTTVLVFNTPRYALGLPFAPAARDDDGWLDLVVFRAPGPFRAAYYLWTVLLGTHLEQAGVIHRRVKKVVVTADQPTPVQIDGDPAGYVLPGGTRPESATTALAAAQASSDDLARPGSDAHSFEAWTLEILPAALEFVASAKHRNRSSRVKLAKGQTAR
jgi:diacylglycerol kinase family enzyme